MNNKRNSSSSSGIGILGVLQIVFLVLKLTGLITWSWTVVLIPLWISLVMLVIFLIVTTQNPYKLELEVNGKIYTYNGNLISDSCRKNTDVARLI